MELGCCAGQFGPVVEDRGGCRARAALDRSSSSEGMLLSALPSPASASPPASAPPSPPPRAASALARASSARLRRCSGISTMGLSRSYRGPLMPPSLRTLSMSLRSGAGRDSIGFFGRSATVQWRACRQANESPTGRGSQRRGLSRNRRSRHSNGSDGITPTAGRRSEAKRKPRRGSRATTSSARPRSRRSACTSGL